MISVYINSKLKRALALSLLLASGWGGLHAQSQTVGGTVTDAQTNQPIVGATIVVRGTSTASITDVRGHFSLSAPPSATLVVSSLGYQPQNVKAVGTALEIRLDRQTLEIDEVVVVGTVMRKSDLTGAVGGVTAKVLTESPVTSVNQALQGRLAGVFISQGGKPTDEATIRIRGINTINGKTDPLYVVDGVQMTNWYGGFSATNVSDIASVEVLKDASATALYGSRGANGVIVITTKKGREETGRVSYDAWVGVQTFGYSPKLMNTQQLFDTRSLAYINGFKTSYALANGGRAPSETEVSNYIKTDIDDSEKVFTKAERVAVGNGTTYSWLDNILRKTGIQHNHVLSFSGANDKGSFYLSFGYMDNKGIIKKTEQTRYTGRVNADYKIKKWLTVGTNTMFTSTFNSLVDDYVFELARAANPFLQPNDTDSRVYWRLSQNSDNEHNPLRSLTIDNHQRINRLTSSNFINIEPIKGLNLRTTLSIDHATANKNKYTPNDLSEALRAPHKGEAKDDRDTRTMWQWDNSISYNTTLGKHRINAMVGTSMTMAKTNWINVRALDFAYNDFSYYDLAASTGDKTLMSDWNRQSLVSYLARASYTYDDRYMVTATLRTDGSSKFAPGHKWGLFPSVSAAWNIDREAFMKNQHVFDQLKLRAGFGVVGNQEIEDYMPWTMYYVTTAGGLDKKDRRLGTPDITWEKQQQWNVGLDMSLLAGRLNFSVDGFLIDNKNLLMTIEPPKFTGYKKAVKNVGEIRNMGVEFSLGAAIIQKRDFSWNFSATFSLDRNKVTKLYGGLPFQYALDNGQIKDEDNLFVGQPRNTYYLMRSAGIAQQSDMWYTNTLVTDRTIAPGDLIPMDINGDGMILGNSDRVVMGSKDPKFYGGFSTDLTWKGISLNAVFTYSYGAKRMGGWYKTITSGYGDRMTSVDLLNNTWTPENTGAKYPRLLADNSGISRWGQGDLDTSLQDASYLRLSTLTLAYTFPISVASRIRMSNIRIYATGTNLFCATPYRGYDPEYGDWYPATRMWTFGLNLSF